MRYEENIIGKYQDADVTEIKLYNKSGNYLSFWTLGARINEFNINNHGNIVLGYKNIEELLENKDYYLGATIGRVAGRISNSKFTLNGKEYGLDANESDNHLHGGSRGYDLVNWDYEVIEEGDKITVKFDYLDKEDENYYPGNLNVSVKHSFDEKNKWQIEYSAIGDKDTIFNPTNHVYFNLNENNEDISNHYLQIDASKIVETNESNTPTGEFVHVEGTDIDFTDFKEMEDVFYSSNEEVIKQEGLDTAFVFDNNKKPQIILSNKELVLEVKTDRDAAVIYTLNKINNRGSMDLYKHGGIAIETQSLPDAINHNGFGSVILNERDKFYSTTSLIIREK